MATSEFDYKEFKNWAKKLKISDTEFNIWAKQFLLEQAQRIVRAARLRTPVDTGALRASYAIGGQEIAFRTVTGEDGEEHIPVDETTGKEVFEIDENLSQIEDISMVGDDLTVIISNPMEYASYVEYGHHSYMGKYMLTIAVNDVMQALPKRFESQFRKWLNSKGVAE